jgi:CheY-like chemotaxis protein
VEVGAQAFLPKPMSEAHLLKFISDCCLSENTNPNAKRQNVLCVDDDPGVLELSKNLIKDYFAVHQQPLNLLTSDNFTKASELIDQHLDELDYVLSDLNIDSSNDGLLLADQVQEQNRKANSNIAFYIITHSNADLLNKGMHGKKVRRFYSHPLTMSLLDEIFLNKGTYSEELNNTSTDQSDKSKVDSECSLPKIVENTDKKLLRKMRSLATHDLAGELDVISDFVQGKIKKNKKLEEELKGLPFYLSVVSEQIHSFVDIAKYSESIYRKNLFIVPFELKFFVDRFIKRQCEAFPALINKIDLENKIETTDIRVIGDERIFEKIVRRIFLRVIDSTLKQDKNQHITFSSSSAEKNTQTLTMTYYDFDGQRDADFLNNLIYNTPWSGRNLKLDYVASGYLINLIGGQISVKTDPLQNTTSFCFLLEKN